jgi:hypothetical protein
MINDKKKHQAIGFDYTCATHTSDASGCRSQKEDNISTLALDIVASLSFKKKIIIINMAT